MSTALKNKRTTLKTKTITPAKSAKTKREQVLSILKRQWVDHTVLEASIQGDPMRRVRELRDIGYNVSKRYNSKTKTFEYKIV